VRGRKEAAGTLLALLTAVTRTAVSPKEATALPSAKRAYLPVCTSRVLLYNMTDIQFILHENILLNIAFTRIKAL